MPEELQDGDVHPESTTTTEEQTPITQKPNLPTIKVGDKELTVTPEIAEVIKTQQDQIELTSAQVNELTSTLTDLSNAANTTATTTPTEPEVLDPLMTEGYTEKLLGKVEEIVKAGNASLTNAYNADKSETALWDNFYTKNTDLNRKDDHFIVEAVMKKNWASLKSLDTEKAIEKLADATREEILRLVGGKKPTKKAETEQIGNNETGDTGETQDKPKIVGLADINKQRREARRAKMTTKVASK